MLRPAAIGRGHRENTRLSCGVYWASVVFFAILYARIATLNAIFAIETPPGGLHSSKYINTCRRIARELMESQIDAKRIEKVRNDFSQQWRTGARPSIENVLPRYDGDHWRLMLTTLLSMEVRLRRESGEAPTMEEYAQRFPGMDAYVRLAFGERSVPHLFPIEWMRWFMRPATARTDASSQS